MSCKELVELVTDYLEGSLSWRQRRRFEKHIAKCDGCTAYLEQIRVTVRAIGTLREEDIPPATRDELLAAFRDWKPA
ncbi:MAG TPA: zf-HC2 domain-containing protein [Thermoleophilaceae bacterium]|jgi:anti-sigma factor RsiW